jgi:methyl acetate hydrolase
MRYLIFSSSFILLLFGCSQKQDSTLPAATIIKTAMDEVMKKSDIPAVVAIVSTVNGEKQTYTYGKAIWTESEDLTPDHIFRIFSMTKLVTSIAAMQLVEKGLVNLDDDLSAILPNIAQIPILSNGQLMEAKNPITLRHLLTHTSGFGYNVTDEELFNFDRTNWNHEDLPRRFESGTAFLYGTSTDWVGKLVEKISGQTLEDYFRNNITTPLGMNRTWFNVPDSLKRFIVSYGNRGADGKQPLKELPNRIPIEPVTEYSGGGGLFSSPADYAILLQCMLNYGTMKNVKILDEQTVRMMNENQIGDISMENAGDFFNPAACCDLRNNNLITSTTKWGLAYLIDNEDKPYGRKAGTVLWGGVFNTLYYIDYKSGLAVSLYTQNLPFNNAETNLLFERFSELVYEKKRYF